MESEISGLADLHAYMKYQNYVTRFSFPYFDMPMVAKTFELRERPDDKLPYDPKKKKPETSPVELKQEPEPPIKPRARVDRAQPELPDDDDRTLSCGVENRHADHLETAFR